MRHVRCCGSVLGALVLRARAGAGCWVLVLGARVPGARAGRWLMDDELRGRHAGAQDPLGVDVVSRDGEAAQSALFSASSGSPASRRAPSTMSPEMPEKQSK